MKLKHILYGSLVVLLAASCREDDIIIYPSEHSIGEETKTKYAGLYILNEGNMGSNKATLDFLDLDSGKYYRNIFPSRNPNQIKELGDVGNDVQIYGNSLWLVINQSNKVEVANARTAVSRGHVDIPNCRYLTFQDGYAYVSSYVGKISEKSVLGAVYKVDTASLKVVDKCTVGFQPEELLIQDGKIYVANSGGYNGMSSLGYDRTVSVIDLKTFIVTKTIDVGINLFRLRSDKYGKLWVSSRGDYDKTPSNLYVLDNDKVESELNIAVDGFDMIGDSLVTYTNLNGKPLFKVLDIRTHKVVDSNFLKVPEKFPIKTAYGLIIHPITGDIFVMDATNYVSSGKLYCFDKYGNYKWHTQTGDIPGHGCFLLRK